MKEKYWNKVNDPWQTECGEEGSLLEARKYSKYLPTLAIGNIAIFLHSGSRLVTAGNEPVKQSDRSLTVLLFCRSAVHIRLWQPNNPTQEKAKLSIDMHSERWSTFTTSAENIHLRLFLQIAYFHFSSWAHFHRFHTRVWNVWLQTTGFSPAVYHKLFREDGTVHEINSFYSRHFYESNPSVFHGGLVHSSFLNWVQSGLRRERQRAPNKMVARWTRAFLPCRCQTPFLRCPLNRHRWSSFSALLSTGFVRTTHDGWTDTLLLRMNLNKSCTCCLKTCPTGGWTILNLI